jgi:hypothetical protein
LHQQAGRPGMQADGGTDLHSGGRHVTPSLGSRSDHGNHDRFG